MEATVMEKGEAMAEWNDGRLDDLSKRMDEGFARADVKMDEGFARADRRMDEGFARVDRKMDEGFVRVDADIRELCGRFDALQETLVRMSLGLAVGLLGVFAALVGSQV